MKRYPAEQIHYKMDQHEDEANIVSTALSKVPYQIVDEIVDNCYFATMDEQWVNQAWFMPDCYDSGNCDTCDKRFNCFTADKEPINPLRKHVITLPGNITEMTPRAQNRLILEEAARFYVDKTKKPRPNEQAKTLVSEWSKNRVKRHGEWL